jgi:hypothetical protein
MITNLLEGGHDGERNVAYLMVVNLDEVEIGYSSQISYAECFLVISTGNEQNPLSFGRKK